MLASKMPEVLESLPNPPKPVLQMVRPDRSDAEVRFHFSRQRYEQMAELGIFESEDKVELLNGEIVPMTPQGFEHSRAIRKLTKLMILLVGDAAEVSVQAPFGASEFSAPEPDVYVLPLGEGDSHHAERALLVIEVGVTSLKSDRTTKLAIYAQANVSDYWIVDVNAKVVEVYRQPRDDHYGAMFTANLEDRIELLELPGRFVNVADIFR